MSIEYDRIYELDTEASPDLDFEIGIDKNGNVEATKLLLSTLSGLINDAIEDAIIEKAAPVGSVKMFAGAVAPSGWLLCDNSSLLRAGTYAALFAVIGVVYGTVDGTHFNIPDFRGIFPRGAGTSDKLTNANAVAFSGVLGTYQNDKIQGHRHKIRNRSEAFTTGVGNTAAGTVGDWITSYEEVTNGTDGTPRTGEETNPANLGINFIIKY